MTRYGPYGAAPVHVTDGCAGCGACLLTCPERAIRPHGGSLLVRPDLCSGCGECIEVCPVDAIAESGSPPYQDLNSAWGGLR